MKERGINSTFKKIIYESSEMVFLADDTFPYNIFYSNTTFDNQIGRFLEEKNLVGLGLDINSYIFKEELILNFQNKEFTFNLELPEQNGSNYFLFYKGAESHGIGLPPNKDVHHFFNNSVDLLGIGQENFLTWISDSVESMIGYKAEEIINVDLCQFFHPDDLELAKESLLEIKKGDETRNFLARIKAKSGEYKWIDWNIYFSDSKFYTIGRDVSDFQEQKAEQEWKNQLYKLGEEVNGIGVWEINPNDKQVFWSEILFEIFEMEGSNNINFDQISDFYLPAFKPMIHNALNELIEKGKDFDLKSKIRTGNGNEKWVRVIGKSRFKEGKVYRTFGTCQDISQEQNLFDELGLFKELFDLSPEAIMIIDVGGYIIFTNQEAHKRLGMFDGNKPSYHISDFDQSFVPDNAWKNHVEELSIDKAKLYQSVLKHPEGIEYPVEVSCNLIQIQGRSYVIAFSRDISEKISLEKSLQESSDFLLHLTEQVPGALYQFVLDSEGRMNFSYLSPGIKTLLELSDDEFSQIGDISLALSRVHPEDMPQVLTSSVVSARKVSPWSCQFRVKSTQGTNYKWVMGAAKPELLENGDVVWYGYLTDITEQKKFESTLKSARESAEKANQIKSEFLSMISHELRTPLNAISGSVYSLLQEEPTPVQESTLNTINFAVENLIIMINDLLDFQKIEAGKLTLEMNPMNLNEVVNQVLKGLEFHARESENNLNLKIKDNLDFKVFGDKVRLSQVLNNLITNALKFTNEGNVDVLVEVKSESDSKVKVYFEVKDTGIGIAKENQNRIFNDFDQIQYSFSKKYGGTGLGLSITKKLLDRMGSKIDFESELGSGSKFFFELEFDKIPNQKSDGNNKSILPTLNFSKIKILMAEDNDVNALVLGKIIKKWGFEYDRVANGEEALEAVRNINYDCVLMDIQMPVMDGFEATEKIKAFSSIPVLALTAAAKLEVIDRIDRSGFDGFVAKPIDAEELLKNIKEVLSTYKV